MFWILNSGLHWNFDLTARGGNTTLICIFWTCVISTREVIVCFTWEVVGVWWTVSPTQIEMLILWPGIMGKNWKKESTAKFRPMSKLVWPQCSNLSSSFFQRKLAAFKTRLSWIWVRQNLSKPVDKKKLWILSWIQMFPQTSLMLSVSRFLNINVVWAK